jgi:hemolysin activation/secretion protein
MAGMCWHVGFLRSARATSEVVFRYVRRQIGLSKDYKQPHVRHRASKLTGGFSVSHQASKAVKDVNANVQQICG